MCLTNPSVASYLAPTGRGTLGCPRGACRAGRGMGRGRERETVVHPPSPHLDASMSQCPYLASDLFEIIWTLPPGKCPLPPSRPLQSLFWLTPHDSGYSVPSEALSRLKLCP